MKLLVRYVAVLLFCFVQTPTEAQQLLFRNFSVADGLPSGTVRAIMQDDKGYMWFGTKNGISRFDGYQFKNFQFKENAKGVLGNNFIHCITRIDSVHLWVGTENGAYILDLETEYFSLFTPTEGKTIFDILKDRNGYIWLASRLNGLYYFNTASGKTQQFTFNGKSNSVSSNQTTRLEQDNDGNIWIGYFGAGIDVYDPVKKYFKNLRSTNSNLSNNFINAIHKGIDGVMWVGTMNGGLCKWQKTEQQFKTYRAGADGALKDDIVRSIKQTTTGKLYVGTEKGLNVLDIATEKFTVYSNKSNDIFSISDNAVYSIYADRNGIVWTGTFFGGVNYFREKNSAFELYYPTGEAGSLSGRAVSCFLEDKPGKYWVGTEDAGLHYYDAVTKTFQKYPFAGGQQKLSYHNVHSLLRDKNGNIWIGLFAGGVNVLNPSTGTVQYYRNKQGDTSTLISDNIFSLYQDKDDVIWVGSDRGLCRFNSSANTFSIISTEGLLNTIIYDMYEDNSKAIWVATHNNGLLRMDKRTNAVQKIKSSSGTAPAKLICLFDDAHGYLWIGTDGRGLYRYNYKTEELMPYTGYGLISANIIYGITGDDNGNLWFSSNNGLYSLHLQTEKIKHYSIQDNLQGKQFNYKALFKARNGNLFAGGIEGFNIINPAVAEQTNEKVAVAVTNFQLFNKDVLPDSTSTGLQKQINYTSALTLKHDQSVMSFEYAGLGFAVTDKLQYAYKMEGFDPDWNYVGAERKATYTNLPPGTYTFKVKATADEGNWNVPEKTIRIIIKPPFYKTTLAYFIYVLLLMGIVYAAYKYSAAYMRRQNQLKVERMKNKEEQEFYARKIEFFTVMAHEIRTPLSLIIAPLEKLITLKKWDKTETEQLHIMEENSERLMDLVNQLLDFRRIESDAYTIKKEKVEVVSLVQSVYSRFSSLPYQKNIEFTLTTKTSSLLMDADPEVLHKILSNLLINAFKFARKKVRIVIEEITNMQDETCLHLRVEDDGIGIPGENLQHIFKKFFTSSSGSHQYNNLGSSGIGLALASSLAEKHGGRLLVESKEGVKTVFTLELPLEKVKEPVLPIETDGSLGKEAEATVLVADDDASLLNFIAGSLKTENYKVLKAANGKQALELIETQSVDIVLSDVMMPVMDGVEFCRQIKSDVQFSHIPLILLTAKSNSEAEIEGIESGADAYISKPFKWKHVLAVVKNLLESREKLKKRFSEQPNTEAEVLTTNRQDKEFIEKVVAIIQQRIIDPQLSVEELSKDLAISRSNLHKKLKSMSGLVPNELIRLVRLKQAAKLLATGENNISEVAYMTGFSSPSYFSKCFLQQFKMTPTDFLEKPQKPRKTFQNEIPGNG